MFTIECIYYRLPGLDGQLHLLEAADGRAETPQGADDRLRPSHEARPQRLPRRHGQGRHYAESDLRFGE